MKPMQIIQIVICQILRTSERDSPRVWVFQRYKGFRIISKVLDTFKLPYCSSSITGTHEVSHVMLQDFVYFLSVPILQTILEGGLCGSSHRMATTSAI